MPQILLEALVIEAQKILEELAEDLKQKIKDEYLPLFQDMIKNINGDIKGFAFAEELDVLDKSSLISLSRKYIPQKECNEVIALKVEGTGQEEGTIYIYLTYALDRSLLPVEDNRYVIIKARSLSEDTKDLFKSELIILK